MSARGEQTCIGLEAAGDLSLNQFQVVRVVSANAVNIASNNAVMFAIGILQDTPTAAGRACRVAIDGESKAVAGAAITAGVPISHNSSGRVIAATSGLCLVGFALEAAAADGDIIRTIVRTGNNAGI